MIVYADASALVKRYITELGSKELIALTTTAVAVATALVSRVEVASAFARAVRMGVLDDEGGRRVQRRFSREWLDLVRVAVTEALVDFFRCVVRLRLAGEVDGDDFFAGAGGGISGETDSAQTGD